jgi:hypothetical protein
VTGCALFGAAKKNGPSSSPFVPSTGWRCDSDGSDHQRRAPRFRNRPGGNPASPHPANHERKPSQACQQAHHCWQPPIIYRRRKAGAQPHQKLDFYSQIPVNRFQTGPLRPLGRRNPPGPAPPPPPPRGPVPCPRAI